MFVVFVDCVSPEESASSIENSMVATLWDLVLCPDDATAINTKLQDMGAACVALCAMRRLW